MADQDGALPPPYLNPDAMQAWQDAQRKQMVAKMLTDAFQQSVNSPNPQSAPGPYAVTPKRGWMQNLAPLFAGALTGRAQNQSLQAQQAALTARYANPTAQGQPTGPGPGIISPDAPQAAQGQATAVGQMQPTPRGLVPNGGSSMFASGMSPGQSQRFFDMMGPQKYAETMMSQYMGTPEWQTALRANNGNAQAAMTQLKAEGIKKGTIDMRAGGSVAIPDSTAPGGYRMVRSPNLGVGQEAMYDNSGNVVGVRNIPGAVQAGAATKGAETAADVANTPRMIPQGGGVEKFGYVGDAGGPGAPPALRQPGTAANSAQPRSTAPANSNQNQRAPSSVTIPQKDSNGIFSNNLPANIPKMQIPSTPGQTSNAYQQKILESAAAKHQELVNKFDDQSASGAQQLEYLTAAEKSLPGAEVGPVSDWLTHNRGMLIESFPSLATALGGDKVSPTLELNKQLTNAALQGARTTFGSRMTQNEVKLQTEEMSPSVAMTRDALASLINQAKMKAAYGIQQDRDYSDYHAAGGDPNRFESQYNVQRPLTRFSAQYATPAAALDRLKAKPTLLPDFKAKYGWDPSK